MIIITNNKKNNWFYIKKNYPVKHIFGRLYLARVWQNEIAKISPWIVIIDLSK